MVTSARPHNLNRHSLKPLSKAERDFVLSQVYEQEQTNLTPNLVFHTEAMPGEKDSGRMCMLVTPPPSVSVELYDAKG